MALRPHLAVGLPLFADLTRMTLGTRDVQDPAAVTVPVLPASWALEGMSDVRITRPRHPNATPPPSPWRRYVAVGDSFTEGLWDVPDQEPPAKTGFTDPTLVCRGWADLLAEGLARRSGGAEVQYANLAIRGRLLGPILEEQVPAALELGPDLVSVIGGGNDLLRPAADPDALAAAVEETVARLRAAGVDVLLSTGIDTKDSPVIRRTRGRTAVLNAHLWTIARRHGAFVLDIWGMRSLQDWRMWAPDRIHLTTEGHRRVAEAALVALGLEPDDPAWDDPMVPLPTPPLAERVRGDVDWLQNHAYPWATRRLHRRSSGDERLPKYAELITVQPD